MPSVADTQRRQTNPNSSLGIISPLSMGFPLNVETTERRRHRKDQDAEKKRVSPDDVTSFRPTLTGIHSHIIWQHATLKGYLTKHIPPVFSFTRNRKRRFVILADRFLYAFKTDTPTDKYREFFELGPNTQAFVTDRMANTLYCIEIRKPGADDSSTWYLQAEDAEGMKMWLERLKKTIQYMVDHKDDKGPITNDKLHSVHSAEHLFFLHGGMDHPHSCNNDMDNNKPEHTNDSNSIYGTSSENSSSSNVINTTPRSSQYEIDPRWRHSDYTNWTDPGSMSTTSPPMSPTALTMTGSLSSSSASTPSPFGHPQQLYFGNTGNMNSNMHRNDSMRSSMSNDDYMPSVRMNSIRSLHSPGLPEVLPPQLPPPTSKLPPPPPHM
ncbi:hypothetical protein BCR42DRAFT_400212 [Absidia repens]|uniref:PH domain-containing protein n=1 Tax=Absidia repens TaxID=90262 RepID=A0A1X2J0S7_9FUNG|nr:hypothetical protein BCR42DRAFT_400212 [Absidia repens]